MVDFEFARECCLASINLQTNYQNDKSEIVLNDYINHMKMELYGRGETMIQVGAGSEGEDGDGQSQTIIHKKVVFL